jgi:galactose mutarotase-like enzyme
MGNGHQIDRGEVDGFAAWTLVAPDAGLEATFVPAAGMLGCSLRHDGEELLDLRDGVAAYARTGATAGIPFLHPWANRLAGFEYSALGRTVVLDSGSPQIHGDQNGLPIHGLLNGSPHWEVHEAEGEADGARLVAELDFGEHEELLADFPFPHVVRIQVSLRGAELEIATTVTPSRGCRVPISFGYHPYLRLPGVPREHWEVELPVRARLELDEHMIPTGRTEPVAFAREPLGVREFDDGYTDLVSGTPFVLSGENREIEIRFDEHYPYAQVYSPPGAEFICYEPMTAPTNALANGDSLPIAEPDVGFTATFWISVAAPQRS